EGPTGILGVLLDACRQAGIPSVSLWAAVPHYVSLAPSPRAALALCRRLGELVGTDIDLDELEQAGEEYAEQVTEAVASDAETATYVEEHERRAVGEVREPALDGPRRLAAVLGNERRVAAVRVCGVEAVLGVGDLRRPPRGVLTGDAEIVRRASRGGDGEELFGAATVRLGVEDRRAVGRPRRRVVEDAVLRIREGAHAAAVGVHDADPVG